MVLELVIRWRSRPPRRLEPRAIAHRRVPPAERPLITHIPAAFCDSLQIEAFRQRSGGSGARTFTLALRLDALSLTRIRNGITHSQVAVVNAYTRKCRRVPECTHSGGE